MEGWSCILCFNSQTSTRFVGFRFIIQERCRQELELAFDVAEQSLGISRLLDVSDITDSPKPDERSIMTYVSEYFHCFAAMDVKELAARRVQKFVQFNQGIEEMETEYESGAQALLDWIHDTTQKMHDRHFGDTLDAAKDLFEAHKKYLCSEKPPKAAQKLDLEALYANIQTKLTVYGRSAYNVPNGKSTSDIDAAWDALEAAERSRGAAVRDHRFKFITKATSAVSEDQLREFEASFAHFDKDSSGQLDKLEFKAALSALSIPFKTDEQFLKVFNQVSQGNDKISKDQFVNYLCELSEDKDSPEQIKQSFNILADASENISQVQLRVPPLKDNEINYLSQKMPPVRENVFDYQTYTDQAFKN